MPVRVATGIPEQGQVVDVRQRHYVVTDVARSTLPADPLAPGNGRGQHLVSLTSIEDCRGRPFRCPLESPEAFAGMREGFAQRVP